MTVSVMRAIGPALSTSLFSLSIDKQYLHGQLVYFVMMVIVALTVYVASLLPRELGNTGNKTK